MNGGELLLQTAYKAGIDVCLANPGTTELPLVAAFDSMPGFRPVLALFEGVCTGAADGYGRMKESPLMTLLHLGPGFANGIANLHNARRASTPVINIIGEHATWHHRADAPLTMDIESLTRTVSGWTRTNNSADELSLDFADAFSAAMRGQVASLIVPNDNLLVEVGVKVSCPQPTQYGSVEIQSIEAAAEILLRNKKTALMLGGRALRGRALQIVGHISTLTGCDLLTETFPAYVERGVGFPDVTRVPYFPEPALALLSQYQAIVLVNIKEPVTFFGYPGIDSRLLKNTQQKISIGIGGEDVVEVLDCLMDNLKRKNAMYSLTSKVRARTEAKNISVFRGGLTVEKACQTVAALQPENAIIVDEGITSAIPYYALTAGLPPHTILTLCGGSIGYGMPCAVGAALACPDRPVINLQADGSAIYTVQALWTEAREGLNVTTLICSNRGYHILRVELERAGIAMPGAKALSLANIDHPMFDWVKVASGMGVPASSVRTGEELAKEFKKALTEEGPHLIEMKLPATS